MWKMRNHASQNRRVSGRSEMPEKDKLRIKMGKLRLRLTIRRDGDLTEELAWCEQKQGIGVLKNRTLQVWILKDPLNPFPSVLRSL